MAVFENSVQSYTCFAGRGFAGPFYASIAGSLTPEMPF